MKNPKKAKRPTASHGKSDAKERIVLVATYKGDQLTKWPGWYNYPIKDGDKISADDAAKITELWLFRGTAEQKNYTASFVGIKTRQELIDEYGYPAKGKAHGEKYLLFKTTFKCQHAGDVPEDAARVIVRTADFATAPKVRKQLKAYLESPDRHDPDLAKCLPEIITKLRPAQLRVCEEAVQMEFFYLIEPIPRINMKPKHSFVDLFAGCGGLSLGLEEAGFTPVLVNELNKDAMATYLLNRTDEFPWLRKNNINNVKDLVLNPKLLQQFIDSIHDELHVDIDRGELDLLCGGPPCQGFSGIGFRRSYSVEKAQLPSNYLFQDMAFLVSRLNPKIFLFENVRGLLTSKWTKDGTNGEIFQMVLKTFHDIGKYNICFKLVHAKDYGVPQNRPRILVVGLRKDIFPNLDKNDVDAVDSGFLPKPTGGAPNLEDLLGDLVDAKYCNGGKTLTYVCPPKNDIQRAFRTKRNGDLMDKGSALSEQEYSHHAPKILAKFRAMHENGGVIPEEFRTKKFSQRLLPAKWDAGGPSITACSAPDDYVHFAQPRGMTVREWARLQMFPDWYQFAGSRTTGGLRRAGNPREGIFDRELPKYTQIGNAVPVGLAYQIGKHFISLLETAQKAEGGDHA